MKRGGDLRVPVSGKVIGSLERDFMHQAVDDGILVGGPWESRFARMLERYIGYGSHACLCNSGSSANLLALSALTSPRVPERWRLKRGDRVILELSSFPTTAAPVYQLGLIPVYIDVELGTYNIDTRLLERTLKLEPRAIMIAHTLGNPFHVDRILAFCAKHNLVLIEDNCDALGSTWRGRKTGSFGLFATQSFYPAHHITTGEGGAVISRNGRLKRIVVSFRDWGRDCWCRPGHDNTCGNRFSGQHGSLPTGYDHKYVYFHIGYNLKMTEMQAACGVAQMQKLDIFTKARRTNFWYLYVKLSAFRRYFILPVISKQANPSMFGMPLTLKPGVRFTRNNIVEYLNERGIGTRLLFSGNILRQPAFRREEAYFIDTGAADYITENSFWVGTWHGLDIRHMNIIYDAIRHFVERFG